MSCRTDSRKKFFAKLFAASVISSITCLYYWFEAAVVLPGLFESESDYRVHLVVGLFLLVSVICNLVFTMFTDSSFKRGSGEGKTDWRYCVACDMETPPRSWHCDHCGVCILKRDHHCGLFSCCVGHYNHKYFFMFLFYFLVGAAYAVVLNGCFLYSRFTVSRPLFLRIFIPLSILLIGVDESYMYLIAFIFNLSGTAVLAIALVYHARLVLKGVVAFELAHQVNRYNLGWTRNVLQVFGLRWYLALLSPFLDSRVPGDGTEWDNAKPDRAVFTTKTL